jgi:hypothetical protein
MNGEQPDPGRLIDAKLPCAPLLREYLSRTATPMCGEQPRRHRRPMAATAALLGGLAAAVLGFWLVARGPQTIGGQGGSEGTSGCAPGTGGISGANRTEPI